MPVVDHTRLIRGSINQGVTWTRNESWKERDRMGQGLDRRFPKLCKWNAFTIDSSESLCKDGVRGIGKSFPLY